mgnify:CR=1 FL=1
MDYYFIMQQGLLTERDIMKAIRIDHPHAITAIIAAKLRHQIGLHAARRYCEKRNCPLPLYYTACRLVAAERV